MELAEVIGHLALLRRFPLRALGGEAPDEARIEGSGLVGDRVYDLYDEREGVLLNARSAPFLLRYRAWYIDAMVRGTDLGPWIRIRKPDGIEVPLSDTEWVEEVSRQSGHPLRLRRRPDAESDPAPLHVVSVPTVRFLEQQYGGRLEPVRLRANLLLDLPEGRPFEEDRWIGRQLWIGDVLLEIVRPSDACIVTVLEAETPERSPGLLSAIARSRGGMLGVFARALTGTRLRVGDPVAIVD